MALHIRTASADDLARLIELLAQLSLDTPREVLSSERPEAYATAMAEVLSDARQRLLVAEEEGRVVGMACFVLVPNLSNIGRPYAFVEDVVVDAAERGHGYGEALMREAIRLARDAGCYKLTLTSNKARVNAHRFYERLGFRATHVGYRMDL